MRTLVIAIVACLGVAAAAGAARAQASPAVLLAAGDIASCRSTGDEATAAILDQHDGVVATLGDNAYPNGTPSEFALCYEPSWGRHKARTRPSAGNHDYATPGAAGYFGYFGAAAGDPSRGYYSYDLGAWHVIALNSNCADVGCEAGSPQEQWLRADLAANPRRCTLAYMHHPRLGSRRGGHAEMEPFWKALYENGADVVLAGHDHVYERFVPTTPIGDPNAAYGIRQFIVGTGGDSHAGVTARAAGSEVLNRDTFGVLKVTLHEASYEWLFLPEAGAVFTDAGSGTCHGAPPDTDDPSVTLTAPTETTVVRGSMTLAAEATDDVAVERVDFLVDGGVVVRDTSPPYTVEWDTSSVGDGVRRVAARAVDRSGNPTTSPARPVVIDNGPPETTLGAKPAAATNWRSATFTFGSEPGATFRCSLDGRAYAPCESPARYFGLALGRHSFAVRSRDAAGNVDTTPASWTWTIDAKAPDTAIARGQMTRGAPGMAEFEFRATERQATFQCSLDNGPWAACASPIVYEGLAPGRHSFRVRAVDAARNVDWRPARWDWVVSPSADGAILLGSERQDVLVGTDGDDEFYALGGDDVVRGLAGDDRIAGGAGRDRLEGGAGNDAVAGETGGDILAGGSGRDALDALDGWYDLVHGGPGRDRARFDRRLDRVRAVEKRLPR